MSYGPERRFASLALVLVSLVTLGACGSAESAGTHPSADVDVRRSSPPPSASPSCSPAVSLTTPAGAPMPPFECPTGWIGRDRQTALPMSGRFESADEIVDAFCTRTDAAGDAAPVVAIDFVHDDVVAIAYEGDVGLFQRGGDLWVRHVERACGEPPAYRTVLFLVPKGEELHEQYCSVACE